MTIISTYKNLAEQTLGLADNHIHYLSPSENANRLGIHELMLSDYLALVSSAAESGIEIKIASGFRSFERQLMIWNNKFSGKTPVKNAAGEEIDISKLSELELIEAILLFSALPGASRHHWGSDIDIYSPNLLGKEKLQLEPWEYTGSGPMAALTSWLERHAWEFNFYFPYDCYRGGVSAEPWHLSYAPLAQHYQSSISVNSLQKLLLIKNIAGKEVIIQNLSEIYKRYINNINEVPDRKNNTQL